MAPFGSPVVPLVKTISARSAAATAADGTRSGASSRVGQGFDPDDGQAEGPSAGRRLSAGEHEASAGPLCHAASEVLGMTHVERYGYAAKVGSRQEGDDPLRPVDRPDDDPVALRDACLGEGPGGTGHHVSQLSVGPDAGPEARSDQ